MIQDKKKILFIITHLALGGAQKHLFSLVKYRIDRGDEVHLIAGKGGFLLKRFSDISRLKIQSIPSLIRTINPLKDLRAFFAIYLYIKKNDFSLIHTHSPKASLLGRWAAYAAGVKNIVYTVHGWPFHEKMNPFVYILYVLLEKINARITQKIIVVSSADLDIGIQKRIAEPEKFELIHCGVDKVYCEKIYRHRRAPLKNNPMVITVSALKAQKGLSQFLAMANQVKKAFPTAQFYIIGEGPLKKFLKRKVKKLHLTENVHLINWHEDLSFFYTHASLFVLSSLWEGLPLAAVEAVLCGIPVVVSNTKGIHDIISQNKQGRIIPLNSLDFLIKTCRDLLNNIEHWNIITSYHRNRVLCDYWDQKRTMKEIDSLYSRL